jgi:predicted phosphodiesterase
VLSDVHGNAVALAAVLEELETVAPDLVVFGGDLTWGPLPQETLALVGDMRTPALFVRGNAERALAELAGGRESTTPRERWMLEVHTGDQLAFLAGFAETVSVDVEGLGPVRFCHGSPRSDEELITFATPEPRMRALMRGVHERVLVSAHTHLQFDREVGGVRSINAGSVGMPYVDGPPGAYWALLGPDVELRRTDYDLDEASRRYRATDDPLAEEMVELLFTPPSAGAIVEHAESLEFSG